MYRVLALVFFFFWGCSVTKPPVNDKGALITSAPVRPLKNRVLIDFCSWTLKTLDPDVALRQSGLDPGLFEDLQGGGMGYRKSRAYGNIRVFFDGNADMGCHVSMSGQGCREFEGMRAALGIACWDYLFRDLLAVDASFTRLDIAIDNVDGRLSLDRLTYAVKRKEIRGKFKRSRRMEDETLSRNSEADVNSETRYFGSMSSRVFFRFYNKAAETELKHDLPAGSIKHWVRCEVVLKAQRAIEAVCQLSMGVPIGYLVVGIINQYLSVIKLDDSNISRCSLRRWWLSWLEHTDKIRLTTQKAIKTIDRVKDHLLRQYSASVAMIRRYEGVSGFREFITEMVDTGKHKMKKRHDRILEVSGYLESVPLPF